LELKKPKDLLSLGLGPSKTVSVESISDIIKGFYFLAEDCFRIITEDGIDSLVSFKNGQFEVDSYSKRQHWEPALELKKHLYLY
jgi:hypothetical protein